MIHVQWNQSTSMGQRAFLVFSSYSKIIIYDWKNWYWSLYFGPYCPADIESTRNGPILGFVYMSLGSVIYFLNCICLNYITFEFIVFKSLCCKYVYLCYIAGHCCVTLQCHSLHYWVFLLAFVQLYKHISSSYFDLKFLRLFMI